MMSGMKAVKQTMGLLGVCLFFYGAIQFQYRLVSHYPNYALMNIFNSESPETLKKVTPPSFRSTLADFYWIRFIQYYFQHMDDPKKLQAAMQSVIALDPYIASVYQFTALTVANGGRDTPPDPKEALRILNEGIQRVPRFWTFYPIKAAFLSLYDQNYSKAQATLWDAMQLSGAPAYLANNLIYYSLRNQNYPMIQQALVWQSTKTLTPQQTQALQQNGRWLESVHDRHLLNLWANQTYQASHAYPVNWLSYHPGLSLSEPPPKAAEGILALPIALPGMPFFSAKDPEDYAYQIDLTTGQIRINIFSPLYLLDQRYQSMYISEERIKLLRKAYERYRTE